MIERTPLLFEGIVAASQAISLLKRRGGSPTRADWERAHQSARKRLGGETRPVGKSRAGKRPAVTWHDKSSPEMRTQIVKLYQGVPGIKNIIDPLDRTDRKEARAKAAAQIRRAARTAATKAAAKRQKKFNDETWNRDPARGERYAAWQRQRNEANRIKAGFAPRS